MPTLTCTEPVCGHQWTEPRDPSVPRCPSCGGFWVRVVASSPARPVRVARRRGRMLARRAALV